LSESRGRPELRLIHDEQSFSQTSLAYWRTKSGDYILASFGSPANPDYSALQVKADGRVLNGNTRLFVLSQKGYDIETIPWTPIK
jgi:hypothetical protein